MTAPASTSVVDRADDAEYAIDDTELIDELLIEEISIDGMCGVY